MEPKREFSLYGDGRLVCAEVLAGGRVTSFRDARISYTEVEDLVSKVVVEGGLVDFSWETNSPYEARRLSRVATDAFSEVLKIHLDSFRETADEEPRAIAHVVRIPSAHRVHRHYPELVEVAAVIEARQSLERLCDAAVQEAAHAE